MTYQSEKPNTTKLLEQGYGYTIVRLVKGELTITEEPVEPSGGGFEVDEGYVKAEIEDGMGVFRLENERYTTPLNRLYVKPPAGMRPLE